MNQTSQHNSAKPQLYGASYSVYVRIVLLTLNEKQIDFDFYEVDIFDKKTIPKDYIKSNPFTKIPIFKYDGLTIYETSAITRYIEDAFEKPPLLYPFNVKERAQVNQIISILDNYAYKALVWDIYVEACESGTPDNTAIEQALVFANTCLQALEDIVHGHEHLIGDSLSAADLHAAPMFNYFMKSPQGQEILPSYPKLTYWWNNMKKRPKCQRLFNAN